MANPRTVYDERLQARRDRVLGLERADVRLANLRLAVAVLALGLAYAAFGPGWLSPLWLLVLAAGFVALVVRHDVVARRQGEARSAVRFYERGLLRLDDRWAGSGSQGERFGGVEHPYAQDLDLFGKGSLFELLCTAHTAGGEARLASFLLERATPEVIGQRQEAARELAAKVDFREELFVLAGAVRNEVHPEGLGRWGEAPARLGWLAQRAWLRGALVLLGLAGLASLVGWGFFGLGPGPFLALLAVDWALTRVIMKHLTPVLEEVEGPSRELGVAARLLARLEREAFNGAALVAVRAAVTAEGAASRHIARLARLVELADARRNQLFAPIAYVLLWGPLFGAAIEGWRARHGRRIRDWLSALAELEALASLGAYTFEHPDDVFAELRGEGTTYVAEGLGHPLLPAARLVRNDVALGSPRRFLLVTGSNMSGKSTLLRSVGVSVVMALAGAPVRARRLTLSPMLLGATLRVNDSLQGGASRFYAEILRLRRIVDLAGEGPLLFLLDEILHGTNSHDRKSGSAAVLEALVGRGAIGLVTTHDLSLAEVVERLGERAANVHFEDHLEGDRLVFDYVMRPGVVERSNAIALMRAIGLPL